MEFPNETSFRGPHAPSLRQNPFVDNQSFIFNITFLLRLHIQMMLIYVTSSVYIVAPYCFHADMFINEINRETNEMQLERNEKV